MKDWNAFIVKLLIFYGILGTVDSMWKLFEYIEYGRAMPSVSDTIIGLVLTYSLYKNLRLHIWTTESVPEEGG